VNGKHADERRKDDEYLYPANPAPHRIPPPLWTGTRTERRRCQI